MPAFVIVVNGEEVCSADFEAGAHGVHFSWIGPATDPEILFHVGGSSGDDLLRWDMPELKIGDEVTIKIVDAEGKTPPDDRRPHEWFDRSGGQRKADPGPTPDP